VGLKKRKKSTANKPYCGITPRRAMAHAEKR
jgi:hypothetical protein